LKEIVLLTINAKWIHPSLALRLLKANLGSLENSCEIIEFALRQPLSEKLAPFLSHNAPPKIIGVSVSIWNHLATIELIKELNKIWMDMEGPRIFTDFHGSEFKRPIVVLGGPEVSHLSKDAEILKYADHVIRGDGEIAFRELCENILGKPHTETLRHGEEGIKSAYHLYTDEDIARKLIYVESSRGCPFKCEFCLSSIEKKIHEFPLEPFLADMDILIQRGVKTFKFLDRSFNTNIKRALKIIEFFLNKLEQPPSLNPCESVRIRGPSSLSPCESVKIRGPSSPIVPFTVHFEMVPSLFPLELLQALTRFPPGTLRLEIGIQTLNPEVSARIGRPSNPDKELAALKFLREKTNAIVHADLIAGLPGEDLASFGRGFDALWEILSDKHGENNQNQLEIQLGILKLLPGTPIARHNKAFGMHFAQSPPYEIIENNAICAVDMKRIKNFARFWEILVNRGLIVLQNKPIFEKFMKISDELLACFGKNWGIDKNELLERANMVNF